MKLVKPFLSRFNDVILVGIYLMHYWKSAFAVATVALLGWSSANAETTLILSPTSVESESLVGLKGSGFAPNEAINLYLYGYNTSFLLTSDGVGAVSAQVEAPSGPGTYPVTAIGQRSADAASTSLAVHDDWPQFRYGDEKRGDNPFDGGLNTYPGTILDIAWVAKTGGAVTASPTVVNGVVYVGSHDHKLYAFDGSTGKTLWAASTGGAIASSPAVSNGIVYVGSNDTQLYAFDALTGKLKWKYKTGGAITSSPLIAATAVYVGSSDGKLYALTPGKGAMIWSTKTGGAVNSSPAYDLGRIYVGSSDENVYAFSAASGLRFWKFKTGGAVNGSPSVLSGIVYIGSADKKFYAVDSGSGTLIWSYTTNGPISSSPVIISGYVVIGSGDGSEYAFTQSNSPTQITSFGSPIAVAASAFGEYGGQPTYFTAKNGKIFTAVPQCCAEIPSVFSLPAPATSPIVFSNDTAYVGASNGQVFALVNEPNSQQQVAGKTTSGLQRVRVDRLR